MSENATITAISVSCRSDGHQLASSPEQPLGDRHQRGSLLTQTGQIPQGTAKDRDLGIGCLAGCGERRGILELRGQQGEQLADQLTVRLNFWIVHHCLRLQQATLVARSPDTAFAGLDFGCTSSITVGAGR